MHPRASVTVPRILWLGGAPCAGKSTVASALARRFGLRVFALDALADAHALPTAVRGTPALERLALRLADPAWPSWFLHDPATLAREELGLSAEVFALAVDALDAMPVGPPILVEGTAALPACVVGWAAASKGRPPIARSEGAPGAAWLVPAADFHTACYERREWARTLVGRTSDSTLAYRNWRDRDMLVARFVRRDALRRGLPMLEVGGRPESTNAPINDTVTWTARALGLM